MDARLTSKDNFSARYSQSRQDLGTLQHGSVDHQHLPDESFPQRHDELDSHHQSDTDQRPAGWIQPHRLNNGGLPGNLGIVAQALGIADGNARGPGLLAINFTGGLATSIGVANVGPNRINWNNSFHYADNLSIVHGRHLMKTGVQFQREQANTYHCGQ